MNEKVKYVVNERNPLLLTEFIVLVITIIILLMFYLKMSSVSRKIFQYFFIGTGLLP